VNAEDDELLILEEVCQKAKKEKKLYGSDILMLFQKFDVRLTKALELVRNAKVSLHVFKPSERKIWVVTGEHGEYLVLPYAKFCSCSDFYFQITKELKVRVCYHLIAQKIAQLLDAYQKEEHGDEEYSALLEKATFINERKV
jgi:predicted nucleic acid-binding Zn finger protein